MRKRIADYYKEKGVDLFEICFQKITEGQIIDFKVSGQSIRMDSKLIGSNIAFYSRYELIKQIECCRLRKQVEELPKEIGDTRNNVEATIYQLAYHLRKDKTKYRGFFKNKIWAILRSLWINFVRIANNLAKWSGKETLNVNFTLHLNDFVQIQFFLLTLTRLESFKITKYKSAKKKISRYSKRV